MTSQGPHDIGDIADQVSWDEAISTVAYTVNNTSWDHTHFSSTFSTEASTNSTLSFLDDLDNLEVSEDVLSVLAIRFHIGLPIVITLGVIANGFGFVVASRPKLRKFHFNRYIQVLAVLDLLSFIARIPFAIDYEYCLYSNYILAFYITYFGWMFVNIIRLSSLYVLMCLSYDRFIAIWFSDRIRSVMKKRVVRIRLIFIFILTIGSFFPMIMIGRILPTSDGRWFCYPGYRQNKKGTGVVIYRIYLVLLTGAIPALSLIVFNIGLLVGLAKRRVVSHASKRKNRQFFQTVAVLVLNVSCIVCYLPYSVMNSLYKPEHGKCFGSATQEALIMSFSSLHSLWSILNIFVFFRLNKDYNDEMKIMLSGIPCISRYIRVDIEESSNSINQSRSNDKTLQTTSSRMSSMRASVFK